MPDEGDHLTAGLDPAVQPEEDGSEDLELEVDADVDLADEAVVVVEDEEEDEAEDEDETAEVLAAPVIRPPLRPQPGRPPSAREEPPPPFAIGERVVLVQNTRPRTGTLIGNYPVGATGRVETVLSQTAIVRFDIAPDTKEVVAFTCLESAEKAGNGKRRG
jgi:hypothetical protein